jgi:hypothetical protein
MPGSPDEKGSGYGYTDNCCREREHRAAILLFVRFRFAARLLTRAELRPAWTDDVVCP